MKPSDISIVLCADRNWVPYARFLISQLDKNNPDNPDVWFCAADDLSSQLPGRVGFLQVAVPDYFRKLPQSDRISLAAYLRLYIPRAFKGKYRRLVYLDCDMFLEGGNLSRLGQIEIPENHALAAVRARQQWFRPRRQMREFKLLNQSAEPYFNSGLLVIDTWNWAALDYDRHIERVLLEHEAALTAHDQSVLNLIARGNWTELSPVWNWMYSGKTNWFMAHVRPNIIHFAGALKPWNDDNGRIPPYFFNTYQDWFKTQGDLQSMVRNRAGLLPADMKYFHRESLLEHFLRARKMKRYLNRFEDPYTAIDPYTDQAMSA